MIDCFNLKSTTPYDIHRAHPVCTILLLYPLRKVLTSIIIWPMSVTDEKRLVTTEMEIVSWEMGVRLPVTGTLEKYGDLLGGNKGRNVRMVMR